MSSTQANTRIAAAIAVILLLALAAQVQHFLQEYKDESAELRSVQSPDAHPSALRKEYSGDFRVYYTAALVAHQAGDHRLYYPPREPHLIWTQMIAPDTTWAQTARSAGFTTSMFFIYPPFAALLMEPLSLFSWPVSILIWRLLLVGMVLVSIYACVLLTGPESRWIKFGIATVAAFSFFPLIEALTEGQIDPLILLCWVGGIYFIKTGRPIWSAFLFALGTLVKVSPAIVVALFLMRRQWKWLFSYAGSIAGLSALSIWRLGWDNHVVFVKQVLPALSCGIANSGNKSLIGFIADLYLRRVPLEITPVPPWVCMVGKVVGLALLVSVLFFFWRRNKTSSALAEELIAVSLVTLLVSPVSWRHHYLLILVPLVFLWNVAQARWAEIATLAVATLGVGTVFPEYLVGAIRNPIFDLVLAGIAPIASLLLLRMCCANYPAAGVPSSAADR